MKLQSAVNKAKAYSNRNLPFSEMHYWKSIFEKTGSTSYQFRYAEALHQCGFYNESEKVYSEIAVNKIPKSYKHLYYSYFGHLMLQVGKLSEALELYKKSLKLKSDETMPYVFIGAILKRQERDQEAIKYLTKALNKKGDIDEVNYNLATSYIRIGKLSHALNSIKACLMVDPKFPNAKRIKRDIEELIKQPKKLILN
ncbi:MAG: hypothetical protein V4722_25805 [Bacteroidota bacterium]